MNHFYLKVTSAFFSIAFSTISLANNLSNIVESYPISQFADLINYVNNNTVKNHPEQLCLIYDMDNTILAAEPHLGGDSWAVWNNSLGANDERKMENWGYGEDFHSIEGSLRYFVKYHPTESTTITTINQIKDNERHPSIVMTARSFERYYAATEHQLSANKLNFASNPIGVTGSKSSNNLILTSNHNNTAFKSYYNGVYYSANDNKGNEIVTLINQQRRLTNNQKLCNTVIFIDNSETNVKNVYNAFVNKKNGFHIIALHYTGYDKYLKSESNSIQTWDITSSNSNAKKLLDTLNSINR